MVEQRIYADPHQGTTRTWTAADDESLANHPQSENRPYRLFTVLHHKGLLNTPRSDATLGATENDEMASAPTREEIDAKIATSEARTDTKFAQMQGTLDLVLQEVRAVHDDTKRTRSNVWGAAAFTVASMIAIVTLLATALPASFGFGAQSRAVIQQEVSQQLKTVVDEMRAQRQPPQ